MIQTSRQLKALVRNMSKGDSTKAQIIIRKYIMERFLERLSISSYRDSIILKGGVLISSMVGIDKRSTMDLDTTIKNTSLTIDNAMNIVDEIINIELDDGIAFTIQSSAPIMDEADYPGIRVMLESAIENMRTPLRLDFSTGDIITPREITYSYKLLFEERTISILAYNLETILAEKFETIISRGVANSRMRDFYDIFILNMEFFSNIKMGVFCTAVSNTCEQRKSANVIKEMYLIIDEVENSVIMMEQWDRYKNKFDYAKYVNWNDVITTIRKLCDIVNKY